MDKDSTKKNLNDLEKLFWDAMKAGNNGISENEIYKVKLVGERTENKLIVEKVKVIFKESEVKVTLPIKLFLKGNELNENNVSLLTSGISVLYIPILACYID